MFKEEPHYLYRGVCDEQHNRNKGKIIPSGSKVEVIALYDGAISANGHFTLGHSQENTARAHQISSGAYGACAVSTSRSLKEACGFASTLNMGEKVSACWGWVYVIDSHLLAVHKIAIQEFQDSLYPTELEVTLLPQTPDSLPEDLIVCRLRVDPGGLPVDID